MKLKKMRKSVNKGTAGGGPLRKQEIAGLAGCLTQEDAGESAEEPLRNGGR